MSAPEIIAVLLSLANVVLTIRRRVENYVFGFAAVVAYAYVFYSAQLYSSALLQVYFVFVQVYGLRVWLKHRSAATNTVAVTSLGGTATAMALVVAAGLAWALAFAMERYTDALTPRLDAPIASLSMVAQLLLARRLLEAWGFWIAVNLLSVYVYFGAGLWLTAALYAVFLALAFWGLAEWRRAAREPAA